MLSFPILYNPTTIPITASIPTAPAITSSDLLSCSYNRTVWVTVEEGTSLYSFSLVSDKFSSFLPLDEENSDTLSLLAAFDEVSFALEDEDLLFTVASVLVRREASFFVSVLSLFRITLICREGVIEVSVFSKSLFTAWVQFK